MDDTILRPLKGPQEDFINLPNSSDPNVESINIAFYGGA